MTNGKNERKDSEAKRRQTQSSCCHASGHGRAWIARRPSIGVPPRFWLWRPNATTRLQFRATRDEAAVGFPLSLPVSVQRCFSQTGRTADRAEDPKPPGSVLQVRARAPHSPARSGLPPDRDRIIGRGSKVYVT